MTAGASRPMAERVVVATRKPLYLQDKADVQRLKEKFGLCAWSRGIRRGVASGDDGQRA